MIKYDTHNSKVELQSQNETLKSINETAENILSNCNYKKQLELFGALYRSYRLSLIHDINEKIKYTNVTDSLATASIIIAIGNIIIILMMLSEHINNNNKTITET